MLFVICLLVWEVSLHVIKTLNHILKQLSSWPIVSVLGHPSEFHFSGCTSGGVVGFQYPVFMSV
jgi:hypothetical protein